MSKKRRENFKKIARKSRRQLYSDATKRALYRAAALAARQIAEICTRGQKDYCLLAASKTRRKLAQYRVTKPRLALIVDKFFLAFKKRSSEPKMRLLFKAHDARGRRAKYDFHVKFARQK